MPYGRALVRPRQEDASPATTDLVTTTIVAEPAQSTTAHKNNVPEIGGSEGGFIGLVVGLGVIFLISCTVIFFLLRNWQHGGRTVQRSFPPSSSDRGGGFRNAVRNTFTKSGELGVESGPEPARRGGTLFGFRQNQRSGWVRAPGNDDLDNADNGPGDVWDPRDHLEELRYDAPPLKLEQRTSPTASPSEFTSPPGPRHFRDPFENVKAQHQRSDSVESGDTMVSPSSNLPGGTKFKEDL